MSSDIIKRLNRQTKVVDGHWLFIGRISNVGYGIIKYNKKQLSVHRLSAHLYLELDLSSNLMSLHKTTCPYKNCWNPSCLYIGTHTDNMNNIRSLSNCPKCGYKYDMLIRSATENRTIRRCRNCIGIYRRAYRKKKSLLKKAVK